MPTTLSSYYAGPVSTNAFPQYSDAELRRDLSKPSLADYTRDRIHAELKRRATARAERKERLRVARMSLAEINAAEAGK